MSLKSNSFWDTENLIDEDKNYFINWFREMKENLPENKLKLEIMV